MRNPQRLRAILVALLMLFSAGAAVLGRPTKHMTDSVGMPNLEAIFPKSFGPWRVDENTPVVLPSPDVQALLDKIYNQVLARTYVNAQGQRIMLSVAYGGDQSDGTSAHRPEVCYPAQGFAITANRASSVDLGQRDLRVRQLMSALGQRHEPITYWVVVGDEIVLGGVEQKLAQMRYGLRGVIADGMLVRVSSIDTNMERALQLQARFIQDLAGQLDAPTAARVFGRQRS